MSSAPEHRSFLTSEYVIEAYIERIKEVNPLINAIAEERFSKALSDAKQVDDYIKQNNLSANQLASLKPFFGVPITIKGSIGVAGLSHAVGMVARNGIKITEDCIVIQRLKNAGFIPILVSTTPEFCCGLESNNLVTGKTCNPFNVTRVAGGSSGGEASLVSSAASIVGLGTDFAGSIRIPCAFTGLFGHKPTPRIIPRGNHYPDSMDDRSYDYFSVGPMVRYAKDLKPVLKVLVAKESIDLKLDEKVKLSALKIFYAENDYRIFSITPVDDAIVNGIEKSVNYFRKEYKCKTKNIDLKELRNAVEIGLTHYMDLEDQPNLLEDPKNPKVTKNVYIEIVKSFFGFSHLMIYTLLFIVLHRYNAFIPRKLYTFYHEKMISLKKELIAILGENGVLLYPSYSTSAFHHYRIFTNCSGISYSMIFNILGFPATQVPIGLDKNKLPVGLQVIAAPKQDRLCLAVAEELEEVFGGWIPPYKM